MLTKSLERAQNEGVLDQSNPLTLRLLNNLAEALKTIQYMERLKKAQKPL